MADTEEFAGSACTAEQIAARGGRLPVSLALQGGGAHGAFTWGVLDLLLEDGRFALDAISATSAGAMNAAAMAHGVSTGGRDGARETLEAFWRRISRAGDAWLRPLVNPFAPWLAATPFAAFANPGYLWMQSVAAAFSPYDLNPLGLNPLRRALEETVDFERLRTCPKAPRLFIGATNVRTGKVHVFENAHLSADAVLASACLPSLFQAVEIDGEAYWDGGFMGNPAIFPLIYRGASRDVIVVHINSIRREEVPRRANEIADRQNEIAFNASLMHEMRAIAFVQRLMAEGRLDGARYKSMRIHDIRDDAAMARYGVDTKYRTDWAFLTELRDLGRRTAAAWLDRHGADVGARSTTPIAELYL